VATAERAALAALLAASGTTVINRPAATRLLADRLALLRHLIVAGIVPETIVSFGEEATLAAIERLGFPALLLAPWSTGAAERRRRGSRHAEALVEQRITLPANGRAGPTLPADARQDAPADRRGTVIGVEGVTMAKETI
jgi:[lysine-biosynthesis-protein LysW]--L-2-aminoadipate ligase